MAYSGAYTFGDSLVDSGNALKLAKWYGTLTFSDLPDGAPTSELGYFQGRFSNGYTFADLISNKAIGLVSKPVFPYGFEDPWLGLPLDPFAGDPSGKNLNFAYGGAHIVQRDELVPELDAQTDAFKDAVDHHADPNALYLITFGGNDVRDLAPTGSDPMPRDLAHAEMQEIADKLLHELSQLVDIGARNIVITGLADVGSIPHYDRDGDGVLNATEQMRSDAATEYSAYLDNLIRTEVVPALQQQLVALGADPAKIVYVPVMDYVNASGAMVTGALNANLPTIAALNGLTLDELTSDPLAHRDLIFFDEIHPNAQAHAMLASFMNAQLANSPWIETMPLLGADVDYRMTGTIAAVGEVDKLLIAMVPGTNYTFDLLGVSTITPYVLEQLGITSLGSGTILADPSLRLVSSGGTVLKLDDDSGIGLDSMLSFNAFTAGTTTLEISAVGSLTGAYALTATVSGAAMQTGNTYTVTNPAVLVLEGAGGVGVDTVKAGVSYALAAGSEIELLSTTNDKGKTAINLTGNEFSQTIVGNAGANIIDGKAGADVLTGGAGKDVFVLSSAAVTNPGAGNIDRITDYASGDVIDVSQILRVAAGTNVSAQGYLRVTTGGLVQVDVNGGGDNWVTLSSVNGTGAVAVRYVSGGASTTISLNRVSATQSVGPAATADQIPVTGAVAAAGLMSLATGPEPHHPAEVAIASLQQDNGPLAILSDHAAFPDIEGAFVRTEVLHLASDASEAVQIAPSALPVHTQLFDRIALPEAAEAHASTFLPGTDASQPSTAATWGAQGVTMPSAEALLAIADPIAPGTTTTQAMPRDLVAQVLADALHDGAGDAAVLEHAFASFHAHSRGSEHADGRAALALFGADGHALALTSSIHPAMVAIEAVMLHQDAVQPA